MGYKFGDSESLGDQALELMGATDKWLETYLNSESFKDALNYMDEKDKAVMNDTFEIIKRTEKFIIDYSDAMDRIEHKIDKIYKLVADNDLK